MTKDRKNTAKSDQANEIQRKYMKEWRKNNTDKVRQANKKYWEKKADQQEEPQIDGNTTKAINIIADCISKDPFSKQNLERKGMTIHISIMEVEPMKKVLSIIREMIDDDAVPVGYIERLCAALNLIGEEKTP